MRWRPMGGLALVAALLTGTVSRAQTIWYVDARAGGAGTGRSWSDAFNELSDALDAAGPGDEVWVARAVYRPGRGALDRTAAFELPDGVAIYGGFSGAESRRAQRDSSVYTTVLSGDLLGDDDGWDNAADNCYNVVRCHVGDAAGLLDGFVITGGRADGPDHELHLDNGGGMHVANGAAPTIRNCVFRENLAARNGGAVACVFGARPVFENCTFEGNRVTGARFPNGGGALFAYSSARPIIRDCAFLDNSAHGLGGAIYATYLNSVLIERTRIENNRASVHGGGVYNIEGAMALHQCALRDNQATDGGGMVNGYLGRTEFVDGVIEGNMAQADGGGLWIRHHLVVRGSVVRDNFAENGGGLFFSSDLDGARAIACRIVANSALLGGGVYVQYGSDGRLEDCLIAENAAAQSGGGVGVYGGGNFAMRNCTVAENDAPKGAGIGIERLSGFAGGAVSIASSILWNPGDEIANENDADVQVTFSDVDGGWPGKANFDDHPAFIDAMLGDFHLTHGSPCRDTGDERVPESPLDFEGDPRVVKGRADVGADEYHPRLYSNGEFASGRSFEFRVIGRPGDPVILARGRTLLTVPRRTPYGPLYLETPLLRRQPLGAIGPDGVLVRGQAVPEVQPGVEYAFQAMIGDRFSNPIVLVGEE